MVTADTPVALVGAYGGGAFTWVDDDRLVVAAADGRLVLLDGDGTRRRVLSRQGRAAAPAAPPTPGWVALALERDVRCDVAVVGARRRRRRRRVLSTADYAWDPAWSPDGRLARLARVGPPEHAVGRVAHRRRRPRG